MLVGLPSRGWGLFFPLRLCAGGSGFGLCGCSNLGACLLLYLDLCVLQDGGFGVFHVARYLCVLIHVSIEGGVGAVGPVWALLWNILLTVPGSYFFCGSFIFCCLVFVMPLCMSLYLYLVVTYWDRSGL